MVDPFQNDVTRIALDALKGTGFVLAGSGAIREHGLISRPTEDVDIFGSTECMDDPERFEQAATTLMRALDDHGYSIETRRAGGFFREYVIKGPNGQQIQMDLGLDYRSKPPTTLSIGDALSYEDSIANKVCALYSRGEARDYLDFEQIRANSGFSDEQLIELAKENDPGFDERGFSFVLRAADNLTLEKVAAYGVGAEELEGVKARLTALGRDMGSRKDEGGSSLRHSERRAAPPTPFSESARLDAVARTMRQDAGSNPSRGHRR